MWREKWLEKADEGYFEKTCWWSDGTIIGERSGRNGGWEEGLSGWRECWRQVLEDGVEKGHLWGYNLEGEKWEEEWETAALSAVNAETGDRLFSHCGQKSGKTIDGKIWSETWGKDDLLGSWGTKHELEVDKTEITEQWGRNFNGDVWVEKWGVKSHALGVKEEWGYKIGERAVRVGEEMDGVTKTEEGLCTWQETWSKIFEADGRMAQVFYLFGRLRVFLHSEP